MSCYAFFQRWLLPSLPISCQSLIQSFSLREKLEALQDNLGCFPLDLESSHPKSVCFVLRLCIRSFIKFGRVGHPPHLLSALPHKEKTKRSTSIDFAENQLSLSLISLSPLITNHPSILLHTRVRSSKFSKKFFNLFMIRSLSFGSYFINFNRPYQTCFHYAYILQLKLAYKIN